MAEQEIIQVRIIKNMERKFIQIPIDTPLIKVLNDEKMDISHGKMELNWTTLCVSDLYKTFADFHPLKDPEYILIHITKCGDFGDRSVGGRIIFPVFVGRENSQHIYEAHFVHAGMMTEVLDRIVNTIHSRDPGLICRCFKKDHNVIVEIKNSDDDDSQFAQIAEIGDFLSSFDNELICIQREVFWRSAEGREILKCMEERTNQS